MIVDMNDFDFLVGRWSVLNRRQDKPLSGSEVFEEFPGTGQCQLILGGLGNFDEINFPTLGYSGASLRLYDADRDEWSIYWASSRTGRLDPPVVGCFRNGIGVFVGDDVLDGRPIKMRFTWSDITATSARWQQEFSGDDGQTWELNWVMELSRVGR